MGWMVLLFLNPLRKFSPEGLLFWIFAGGITYSVGIIFYALKKIPYHHLIWHLFVLGGSACFFIGFLLHLE
jgi:hemolysin III